MSSFRTAKLTATLVDRLRPNETVMDSQEPGFGVRRQNGGPRYFVRKHANGQRHFVNIGEHGTGGLTVSKAREQARKIIMGLRDGISPAQQRARDRAMPTVKELSDRWLELHVDVKLKPSTAKSYRSLLKLNVLPVIGRTKVDQVDRAAVARMHHKWRSTPYAANRALAVVSKLMAFAEREGFRQANTSPAVGVERFREKKRQRYLSNDEFGGLGDAMREALAEGRHSQVAIAAIWFLMLTGMRLQEVLRLRWNEVDLDRGMLLLGDSKTGQKAVTLGEELLGFLTGWQRFSESPWVFPSMVNTGKPMHDVRKAWQTITTNAGLKGLKIHDLRHSFASVAAGQGGSLPMIGRLLGHSQPATTSRYAHLADDPVRTLANSASGEIRKLVRLQLVPADDDDEPQETLEELDTGEITPWSDLVPGFCPEIPVSFFEELERNCGAQVPEIRRGALCWFLGPGPEPECKPAQSSMIATDLESAFKRAKRLQDQLFKMPNGTRKELAHMMARTKAEACPITSEGRMSWATDLYRELAHFLRAYENWKACKDDLPPTLRRKPKRQTVEVNGFISIAYQVYVSTGAEIKLTRAGDEDGRPSGRFADYLRHFWKAIDKHLRNHISAETFARRGYEYAREVRQRNLDREPANSVT